MAARIVFMAVAAMLMVLPIDCGVLAPSVIHADAECPQQPDWRNPDMLRGGATCHSWRMCNEDCDSYLFCCPFESVGLNQEQFQMVWDNELKACVRDDPKNRCEDALCEGPTGPPRVPQPDDLPAAQCWVNGLVYERVNDTAFFIAEPELEPYTNEVQVCRYDQTFSVAEGACGCVGDLPQAPADGLCIDVDSAVDGFINSGTKPAGLAFSHDGVTQRDAGYWFNGISHHCFEFPYFNSLDFWSNGFALTVEARGSGLVLTNGKTTAGSTVSLGVEQDGDDLVATCYFDTLETPNVRVTLPDTDSATTFVEYQLDFCPRTGAVTLVCTRQDNQVSAEATGNVTGESISRVACPLTFGCNLENVQERFVGHISNIQMRCSTNDC